MKSKVKSPCVRVCTIKDGLCQGCYRTLDEIAKWQEYSEYEKSIVIDNIEKRKGS